MTFDHHIRMSKVIQKVHINMPWKQLPRHLDLVLKNRFNIEIGLGGVDLDTLSPAQVRDLADQLRQREIRISLHGPFWDLCAGSTDPLIRQATRTRLQQLFDLVPLFKPVQVVCHTGYDPRHHGNWHQFLDYSLTTWEPLLKQAEAMQVPLLLENVWEHDPQFHQALFSRFPTPYLGFCLDVGHQHSFSHTPLQGWLDNLADRLQEIHIHDNNGSNDAHLPVGHGTIDFDALFQFIKRQDKQPLLTVEPHQVPHLFETLKALGDILERHGLLTEEATDGHCGSQHRPAGTPNHQPQSLCGSSSGGTSAEPAPL